MRGFRVPWRNQLRLRIRFYNRLMLYNTLIFLVVAYLFAFIASRYAQQLETIKQLQMSRDALNAVYNYYDNKQNNFLNLVFSLYDPADSYNTLSDLLESRTDDQYDNDPFAKQAVVEMLERVAVRDSDIAAVLIYKNVTGAGFLYTRTNRLLERVSPNFPFIAELGAKTAGRTAYGTRTISAGTSSQRVFGIAGTLGSKNIRQQAGQFLFAYDAQSLNRVLQAYEGKTQGRFMIVTDGGEIVFDSGDSPENANRGATAKFAHMDIVKSGVQSSDIDGKSYYIQTIKNETRQYFAVNLIPKRDIVLQNANTRLLIYGLFTVMALLCALLYSVAGRFVSRRVNELIRGMKRVSSNNLGYRIPLSGRNDEFEEIAARFNLMVNELQLTINREYVSEIKKKNAELQALQAGINPHFLYNTLEAIRIKAADDGNDDVSEMIVLLATLYRSIVRDRTFTTIRKEIYMCRMYLDIFSLRYASSLDIDIQIDAQVMEYGIPKNLLQPIIENYFVHGIHLEHESNRFAIRGWMEEGDIHFLFEDNGRGMDRSRLEEVRIRLEDEESGSVDNYGLSNVNERIRLVYGDPYGLRVESEEGRRTRVFARFKAMTPEDLEHNLHPAG